MRFNHFIVIITCLFTSFHISAKAKKTRHILVLNSYHQEMTWVRNMTQGIEDVFKSDEYEYVFHIEDMDSKRHFDDIYFNALFELYVIKYNKIPLDLIISADNNSFDFLRKYNNILFPDVPIVFGGVSYFKSSQIKGKPEFTGVTEFLSDVDTIKTILKLHPNTKEIFIVNDFTPTGQAWTKTMKENLSASNVNEQVKISFAENIALNNLQLQLEKLDDDVIVLLGVYFKDKKGKYSTFEKIQKELFKNIEIPIYALLNFNVSENIIGGKVISGYSQGARTANIGLKILQGSAPIDIPVVEEGVNEYVFNWPMLNKWNINLDLLPKDSLIINHPISFYDKYKMLVWGTISLITFLISALIFQIWLSSLQKSANNKLEKIVYKRTKDLSLQSKMLEDISHLSTTGGWQLDIDTLDVIWSKETYSIFELPESFELKLDEVINFFTDESKPVLTAAIKRAISTGNPYDLELSMKTANGRLIWVRALCEVIYENDTRKSLIGAIQDITERKKADDKIRHLAMTDSLTGLANRTQFNQRFKRSIKLAKREKRLLALMMIDLDKFKLVNDTFGHQVGDELLQAVATTFTNNARETDIIARLGGDEFAILIVHPDKDDDESVSVYAQRLINEISRTVILMGNEINIGLSIGISFYPKDSSDPNELLKKADFALYKSKSNGGGNYTYYHSNMNVLK